ncbi:MAG TPA: GDP-mannose 4,6-dehydratase [Vicinamibacterales bacterium]
MAGLPLITGATGFAGSHLVEHLLDTAPAVAAWGNPNGSGTGAADRRIEWAAVDLLDRDAVSRALGTLRPSVIYHCAGSAHVGDSFSQPERALRLNVIGTHHVLEAARAASLDCRILVIGSGMIYRDSDSALDEQSPIGPSSPYGVSKLAQEMRALRETELPVVIARPFNHAGPRQAPSYVTSSFAQQIAEIEAGRREPVLHVGNLESRRDIMDVRDTVRAYRLLAERGTPGRAYNVCSGTAYRVRDLLDQLVTLARVSISIEIDPSRLRPSDNPVILGDCTRLREETGWQPEIPMSRTLADLLDYWRQRTARQ